VNELSVNQRKALSDFANTIAAAWFTAGIISPLFTKPKSPAELLTFVILGISMTWAALRWSLILVEDAK